MSKLWRKRNIIEINIRISIKDWGYIIDILIINWRLEYRILKIIIKIRRINIRIINFRRKKSLRIIK